MSQNSDEKADATYHGSEMHIDDKLNFPEVNTASEALAVAIAQDKPNPWGSGMIRLYAIMGIGYLVSTMNGFG